MKFLRSARLVATALAATAAAASGVLISGSAAHAAVRPNVITGYKVTNAPNPIALDDSPAASDVANWVAPIRSGDPVTLQCYFFGGPVAPYGNILWYFAQDNATGDYGWINDHYLTTPGTATNPQPLGIACEVEAQYYVGVASDYTVSGFHTTNVSGTVTLGNFPTTSYSSGYAIGTHDTVLLGCYSFGGPAGNYSNTLWYRVWDRTTNTSGWINDHYLTTPGTAANPQPQSWICDPAAY